MKTAIIDEENGFRLLVIDDEDNLLCENQYETQDRAKKAFLETFAGRYWEKKDKPRANWSDRHTTERIEKDQKYTEFIELMNIPAVVQAIKAALTQISVLQDMEKEQN